MLSITNDLLFKDTKVQVCDASKVECFTYARQKIKSTASATPYYSKTLLGNVIPFSSIIK
jgi:hypothetical protein